MMVNILNKHSLSLQVIDRKLNGLFSLLQTSPSPVLTTPGTTPVTEDIEMEDHARTIIKRMSSSIPQVRAKTNFIQCLDAMGFPITTSLEDVSVIIIVRDLFGSIKDFFIETVDLLFKNFEISNVVQGNSIRSCRCIIMNL